MTGPSGTYAHAARTSGVLLSGGTVQVRVDVTLLRSIVLHGRADEVYVDSAIPTSSTPQATAVYIDPTTRERESRTELVAPSEDDLRTVLAPATSDAVAGEAAIRDPGDLGGGTTRFDYQEAALRVPNERRVRSIPDGPVTVSRHSTGPWRIDSGCEVLVQPVDGNLWVANSLIESEPCWLGTFPLGEVARPVTKYNARLRSIDQSNGSVSVDLDDVAANPPPPGLSILGRGPEGADRRSFATASDSRGIVVALGVRSQSLLPDVCLNELAALAHRAAEYVVPGDGVRRSLIALIDDVHNIVAEPDLQISVAVVGLQSQDDLFLGSTPDVEWQKTPEPASDVEGDVRGGLFVGRSELVELLSVTLPGFQPLSVGPSPDRVQLELPAST